MMILPSEWNGNIAGLMVNGSFSCDQEKYKEIFLWGIFLVVQWYDNTCNNPVQCSDEVKWWWWWV